MAHPQQIVDILPQAGRQCNRSCTRYRLGVGDGRVSTNISVLMTRRCGISYH